MITPMDEAWERINALGGYCEDDFDRGINFAICEALKIIESLGGVDPAPVRKQMAQDNSQGRRMNASTHTLTADVEVKFDPVSLVETEVEYPVLEIEFSYLRGHPAFTPRGEYAPVDPPEPAEVDFRSAKLIDGKGLLPTQDQINDWARDYLDSDEGYRHACNEAQS